MTPTKQEILKNHFGFLPIPGETYIFTLTDGSEKEGVLFNCFIDESGSISAIGVDVEDELADIDQDIKIQEIN